MYKKLKGMVKIEMSAATVRKLLPWHTAAVDTGEIDLLTTEDANSSSSVCISQQQPEIMAISNIPSNT